MSRESAEATVERILKAAEERDGGPRFNGVGEILVNDKGRLSSGLPMRSLFVILMLQALEAGRAESSADAYAEELTGDLTIGALQRMKGRIEDAAKGRIDDRRKQAGLPAISPHMRATLERLADLMGSATAAWIADIRFIAGGFR